MHQTFDSINVEYLLRLHDSMLVESKIDSIEKSIKSKFTLIQINSIESESKSNRFPFDSIRLNVNRKQNLIGIEVLNRFV